MKTTHIRQKLIVSALAGAVMIPGSAIRAYAADDTEENTSPLPVAGIESVLTDCYETTVKDNIDVYLVPTETGEYLNRAFSNVSDYVYIRSAPDEAGEWVGKLYSDSAVNILEYAEDWVKIQSGSVEGYVPASVLYTGTSASEHAQEYEKIIATVTADVLNVRGGQGTEFEILTQVVMDETLYVTGDPQGGWYPIETDGVSGWVCGDYVTTETEYSYAESREEEEARIEAEEAAAQIAEEEVSSEVMTDGQSVVAFACQFIGNPYVWGGTSLTDGADCSGFVQSVYANFGISLPRTTGEMVSSGYEVSYEEAQAGDLILYEGHVGIYMGDGNIINAMNEEDGIGICSATYTSILTVRRVL